MNFVFAVFLGLLVALAGGVHVKSAPEYRCFGQVTSPCRDGVTVTMDGSHLDELTFNGSLRGVTGLSCSSGESFFFYGTYPLIKPKITLRVHLEHAPRGSSANRPTYSRFVAELTQAEGTLQSYALYLALRWKCPLVRNRTPMDLLAMVQSPEGAKCSFLRESGFDFSNRRFSCRQEESAQRGLLFFCGNRSGDFQDDVLVNSFFSIAPTECESGGQESREDAESEL